jgi:hypothetical protein
MPSFDYNSILFYSNVRVISIRIFNSVIIVILSIFYYSYVTATTKDFTDLMDIKHLLSPIYSI